MKKILLLILITIKFSFENDCSSFKTCIECSINKNCIWKKNLCENSNLNTNFFWFENYENCLNDEITLLNMNNYCISSKENYENKKKNGNYIPESKELFCKHSININEEKNINIKYSSNILKQIKNEIEKEKIIQYSNLLIEFSDETSNLISLQNKYNYLSKNIKKITLYFLFKASNTSLSQKSISNSLFKLNINYISNFSKSNKIILTLGFLIGIIHIFIFLMKKYEITFKELKEKIIHYKNIIEMILKIGPITQYDSKKLSEKFNDTCLICLKKFIEMEKIKILPCKHIYHLDCINKVYENKIIECPKCKKNFNDDNPNNKINNDNINKNIPENEKLKN